MEKKYIAVVTTDHYIVEKDEDGIFYSEWAEKDPFSRSLGRFETFEKAQKAIDVANERGNWASESIETNEDGEIWSRVGEVYRCGECGHETWDVIEIDDRKLMQLI